MKKLIIAKLFVVVLLTFAHNASALTITVGAEFTTGDLASMGSDVLFDTGIYLNAGESFDIAVSDYSSSELELPNSMVGQIREYDPIYDSGLTLVENDVNLLAEGGYFFFDAVTGYNGVADISGNLFLFYDLGVRQSQDPLVVAGDVSISRVPEPLPIALLGIGVLAMLMSRKLKP